MPIIALQRRHHQIGRIRIGVQVPVNGTTKGGKPKTRPVKLETFRLTSSDKRAIDAAAALYGGEAHPWEEQEGQFEVITDTNELSIAIPPDGELSQWYELWSGGGCVRRCDGQWEQIGDQACVCDPENERDCSPHTRLSVVLTDLPGMGMWRLDTQGWYAATELAGTINLLAAAADRGTFLPARLRLEQRQVKRPGQALRKFAVPVVDLDVPLLQVPALISGSARAALGPAPAVALAPNPETGELPAAPGRGLTPVPETLMGPTVADQVKAAEEPRSRSRESTPKLPATGRRPRPVAEAAAQEDTPFRPGGQEAPPAGDDASGPTMPFPQFFAMRCREVLGGETVEMADRRRHDLIAAVTAGSKTRGHDLTLEEQHQALAWLDMIKDGTAVLEHDENHRWVVRPCDEQDGPCPEALFDELEAIVNTLTDEQRKLLGPLVQNRVQRMRTQAGERNPRFSHRHHMRTCDALEALGFDQLARDPEPEAAPPVEDGEPF